MSRLHYELKILLGTLIVAILFGLWIWLWPVSGQVIISPSTSASLALWPQFVADPALPQPGEKVTLTITGTEPWANLSLMIHGHSATLLKSEQGLSIITWVWTFQLPEDIPSQIPVILYSDCHTGCRLRAQATLATATVDPPEDSLPTKELKATKLCVIFPNPERDWHNRSAWAVDLTYARWADSEEDRYWTVDALAERVYHAKQQGLRILVRVDFDKGQTLPPADDLLALEEYLGYVRRLARDERLQGVYGYIIGSGFNALGSSSLAPDRPITPTWYARLFNGYGEPVARQDNVMETIRNENPSVQVLVGPVRPWVVDQSGSIPYEIDVPWLSYMNTVVALLAESANAKAAIGNMDALPDGFALNPSGRVTAPELANIDAALEPRLDIARPEWDGAQAGFRVYQDFLTIINSSPTMQGRPAYINATNTFTPDEGVPPAQNYPAGWLENALDEVNTQPQIQTLCWFLDFVPGDNQWEAFSLTHKLGRLQDASDEFDMLLQRVD